MLRKAVLFRQILHAQSALLACRPGRVASAKGGSQEWGIGAGQGAILAPPASWYPGPAVPAVPGMKHHCPESCSYWERWRMVPSLLFPAFTSLILAQGFLGRVTNDELILFIFFKPHAKLNGETAWKQRQEAGSPFLISLFHSTKVKWA